MKFDSNTTKADLEALETSEILEVHNRITGKSTKKFASRAKGIQQTLRALADVKPRGKASGGKRRRPGLGFRMAPRAKTGADLKVPREGTHRAEVLRLISRKNGALFSEIADACGWNEKQTYEGVRLLNVFSGYGLWDERIMDGDEVVDYRIRAVDAKEFERLVAQAD